MPIIHNLPYTTTQTDARYLRRDANSGPSADITFDLGSSSLRWANVYSVNFVGTATTTLYADVAERFSCSAELTFPGDIVSLGGSEEVRMTQFAYDPNVLGVVSTSPALAMNSAAGTDRSHPYIALSGRVPCKILGPGKKGQRVVSSEMLGVAMAIDDARLAEISPYCVIGRLLEDTKPDEDGIEFGLYMVLVGVK